MTKLAHRLACLVQSAAVRLVGRPRLFGLRHSVTCSAILPLVGASWWRVAVYRDQPGDEGASESLLDVRAFGCSVEVFYRPR